MLHNVDRLRGQMIDALKTLASSSSPCSSSSSSAGQDTVTLMLRMGQSPSTLAKQQYLIQLRGIFRLPCTAQQADEQRPQPVRQVFGGKSAIPSSSMSRLPALERKLVRFLLSASMEESPLAHALAAPVGELHSARGAMQLDMTDKILQRQHARRSFSRPRQALQRKDGYPDDR